jgi:type VI secretion system protein ImpH
VAGARRTPGVVVTTTNAAAKRRRLEKVLEAEGTSFEFFQAMRLLVRLYPDRPAVGGWDDPAREVVRMSVPPSLAFPPSEIARLELPSGDGPEASSGSRGGGRAQKGEPARMAVRFLGLTGPQGVLPHIYTEYAASRSRARDTAFRDFLDLFHHRALSLFYRAWERHHTSVAAERGEEDRMRSHLLDLVGAGTAGVRAQSAVSAETLGSYAGLLAMRSRPADGLAQMVSDHFAVPVTIEQFVGQWQPLRHGGQISLGADDEDGQLGSAVVGNAVFDPLARVRLRIGPLSRDQFNDFLPGGSAHEPLQQLARLYADDQVGVEAQLILARDEVPAASLGVPAAPALGFGTWLRSKPPVSDREDVRLTLC